MNHVAKIIDVVGTSEAGIEDAIDNAIARAAKTIDHLQWFHVTEIRGTLDGKDVSRYQVVMRIGFSLTDGDDDD